MRFVSIRLRWISWRSTTEVILNICNWTVWRMKIKHRFAWMSRSETRTVRQHSNSRESPGVIINVRLRPSNPLIPQSGRLLSKSLLVCIHLERKRIWSAVIEKFSLDPVKPVLVRESQGSRHISLQWTFASVTNIQSFDLFENNQSIFSSNVTDYLANQTQFSRNITDGLLPFHTYALSIDALRNEDDVFILAIIILFEFSPIVRYSPTWFLFSRMKEVNLISLEISVERWLFPSHLSTTSTKSQHDWSEYFHSWRTSVI